MTTTQSSALAEINDRNRQFWLAQSELLNTRIQDSTLYEIAMVDLSWEQVAVPVKNRRSLEQILASAEKSRTIFQRAFSHKGGKVAKVDGLQSVIIESVLLEPDINVHRLKRKLSKMAEDGDPIIRKVDQRGHLLCDQVEQIHFVADREIKTASVSGLKDRLSRAKKKILSR